MTHYDKTRVTFHHGNAFDAEGITPTPFATFTCTTIVDRTLIDTICELVRDHINKEHGNFCNFKLTTEDWDC